VSLGDARAVVPAADLHPITLLRAHRGHFVSLGYAIEDGREIGTDFYNRRAMNIPLSPGRAPQVPSTRPKGSRCDHNLHGTDYDAAAWRSGAHDRTRKSLSPRYSVTQLMFYQVEGLCVDRGIDGALRR
jgi:hypothetical protein